MNKNFFAIMSVFVFTTASMFSSEFVSGGVIATVGAGAVPEIIASGENLKSDNDNEIIDTVEFSGSGIAAYVEGCKLYSEGDWTSATIMLKKAVSYAENFKPDVYYMLITAEVYADDKKSALDDCNIFLSNFSDSSLCSRVKYHKGKILYDMEEYDKAIIELSDFCHQYVGDELYPYGLYYIGESLFAGYRYEEAKGIFSRVVSEFPESDKAPAAQYKIDTILQHNREEKLLYLLKQTGEEYLSAKEEYEKQLKMYNSETVNATRQKLSEALSKNSIFEKQIADLQNQLEAAKAEIKKVESERDVAIERYNELSASQQQYVPAVPIIEGSNTQTTANEEVKTAIEKEDDKDESVAPVRNNENASKNVVEEIEDDIPSLVPYDETQEQLRILKEKAREVQKIFESKK